MNLGTSNNINLNNYELPRIQTAQEIETVSDGQNLLNNSENKSNVKSTSQKLFLNLDKNSKHIENRIQQTKNIDKKNELCFISTNESDKNQENCDQIRNISNNYENEKKDQVSHNSEFIPSQKKSIKELDNKKEHQFSVKTTKQYDRSDYNSNFEFEIHCMDHSNKKKSNSYESNPKITNVDNTQGLSAIRKYASHRSKHISDLDTKCSKSENEESIFNQDEIINLLVAESEKIEECNRKKKSKKFEFCLKSAFQRSHFRQSLFLKKQMLFQKNQQEQKNEKRK